VHTVGFVMELQAGAAINMPLGKFIGGKKQKKMAVLASIRQRWWEYNL
jgi:hypothetical protein